MLRENFFIQGDDQPQSGGGQSRGAAPHGRQGAGGEGFKERALVELDCQPLAAGNGGAMCRLTAWQIGPLGLCGENPTPAAANISARRITVCRPPTYFTSGIIAS